MIMDVFRGWCLYGNVHIYCETKLRWLKFALIVIFQKLDPNSSRRSDTRLTIPQRTFFSNLMLEKFCKKPNLHVTERIGYYTTQTDEALFSIFIGCKLLEKQRWKHLARHASIKSNITECSCTETCSQQILAFIVQHKTLVRVHNTSNVTLLLLCVMWNINRNASINQIAATALICVILMQSNFYR